MKQILFDTIKSWDDLGMLLTGFSNESPAPKRQTVDVLGMDGELDVTPALSKIVRYANKQVTLQFAMKNYNNDWYRIFGNIKKQLHGKYMAVSFADEDYYWDAFVTVDTDNDGNMGTVVVTLDAAPYDMDKTLTAYTAVATTNGTRVTCVNDEMEVMPVFKSTDVFSVRANDRTVTFDAGEHQSPDIVLGPGSTEIIVSGESWKEVTITYRKGRL